MESIEGAAGTDPQLAQRVAQFLWLEVLPAAQQVQKVGVIMLQAGAEDVLAVDRPLVEVRTVAGVGTVAEGIFGDGNLMRFGPPR